MSSKAIDSCPSYDPYVIFLSHQVLQGSFDYNKIVEKVTELFQIHNGKLWSHKQHFTAVSHFFDSQALSHLTHLISEIQKIRSVWVVMTSDWRSSSWSEGNSADDIKEMLGIHDFAKYIIDKIPEKISKDTVAQNCNSNDHLDAYKHEVCKASRIQYWLKNHPEVKGYCILDDWEDKSSRYKGHLSSHFGKRFFLTGHETLLTEKITKDILSQFKKS